MHPAIASRDSERSYDENWTSPVSIRQRIKGEEVEPLDESAETGGDDDFALNSGNVLHGFLKRWVAGSGVSLPD